MHKPFNQSQPQKPTFNVNPPFMGVLMVQVNHAMSIDLQEFIGSINDVEEEIIAFKNALRDPKNSGAYVYKEGPSFMVVRSFKGVVMIEMNQEMRELLISFISDIEGGVDKIIWAFRLALENPQGGGHKVRNREQSFLKRQRIRGAYSHVGSPNPEDEEYEDDEEFDEFEGDDAEGDEEETEEASGQAEIEAKSQQ